MQQQVVGIDFFNELLAAVMFQVAQRATLGNSSGGEERVQWRGK